MLSWVVRHRLKSFINKEHHTILERLSDHLVNGAVVRSSIAPSTSNTFPTPFATSLLDESPARRPWSSDPHETLARTIAGTDAESVPRDVEGLVRQSRRRAMAVRTNNNRVAGRRSCTPVTRPIPGLEGAHRG
jgi:hypothetical protein